MDRHVIERCCRKAGLTPEKKLTLQGMEIYIADGYSTVPHEAFARFGVKKGELPIGCYVTMWWAAKNENQVEFGMPIFFEPNHNPEIEASMKKKARINTAIKEASGFLKRKKKARLDA